MGEVKEREIHAAPRGKPKILVTKGKIAVLSGGDVLWERRE